MADKPKDEQPKGNEVPVDEPTERPKGFGGSVHGGKQDKTEQIPFDSIR